MFCLIAPTGALPGLHAGPNLQALLRGATELKPVRVDEQDLHSPLERCLSRLRGGPESGALPLAAWRLPASPKTPAGLPWALVSPLHIELQASQAVALPQQALQLSAAHSQALFGLLSPLFPAEEGWHQQQLDTFFSSSSSSSCKMWSVTVPSSLEHGRTSRFLFLCSYS